MSLTLICGGGSPEGVRISGQLDCNCGAKLEINELGPDALLASIVRFVGVHRLHQEARLGRLRLPIQTSTEWNEVPTKGDQPT